MSASQIFNLNNDIVRLIFDTITSEVPRWHTRGERPLTVVRFGSQVCRQWREVLLRSPWIWGRLIDLDGKDYGSRRAEWMDEVLRRAGSAPLWIYGHVRRRSKKPTLFDTQSYFIRLLTRWERVEQLSVVIYRDEANTDGRLPDEIRTSFHSRAPILKLFDVYFTLVDDIFLDSLQPGPSESLFANHAPLLRTIKTDQLVYKLDSPWLSNIREIFPFPKKFTLKDIFVVLQHAPAIERVGINAERLVWDRKNPPFPKISVPNLSSIKLWATIPVLGRILDCIRPGPLSTLFINVWDPTTDMSDPYVSSSLKQNLESYISRSFFSNSSTTVMFTITNTTFRFCDLKNSISDGDEQNMDIDIRTVSSNQREWPKLVCCLLEAVTHSSTFDENSSLFRSITHIWLTSLEVQSTMIQELHSMLAVFQHVQHLETTEDCGYTLWALACLEAGDNGPAHVLFPELHTLHLMSIDSNNKNTSTDLTRFFLKRKNSGYPVAKLDLTECERSNYAQDLRDLDAIHGLEVVWWKQGTGYADETSSYICGSGSPETLKGIILYVHLT